MRLLFDDSPVIHQSIASAFLSSSRICSNTKSFLLQSGTVQIPIRRSDFQSSPQGRSFGSIELQYFKKISGSKVEFYLLIV